MTIAADCRPGGAGVSAAIVNYDGLHFLPSCIESLIAQSHPPAEIVLVDNRSADRSVGFVRERFPAVRVLEQGRNLGYAGGANVAVRETRSPYLLLLNPDVVLTPTFLGELVAVAERYPEVGSLTGKLRRRGPERAGPVIDSTGHVLYRNRWAINRGEREEDRGQYDQPGEVFGVSGAAPLYRRAMLEDVRVEGEVFPESFFLYLEDVDLDWRARLRGWKAYYVPTAIAYHDRGYKGGLRRRDPAVLRHSFKNRYLMMIRNEALGDVLLDAWAILPMEVLRFTDFLLTAPRSLAGYVDVARLVGPSLRQRRMIRRRVRVPRAEIRRWLHGYPYGRALAERARLILTRSPEP
jgi:GT2 family glycosyltransferase